MQRHIHYPFLDIKAIFNRRAAAQTKIACFHTAAEVCKSSERKRKGKKNKSVFMAMYQFLQDER